MPQIPGIIDIITTEGAPTNGVTFAGIAAKGCLLIDTDNAKLYINEGSITSPIWTLVGLQSGGLQGEPE